MKNSKTTVLAAAVAILVVLGAYQQGKLNADSEIKPAKIGVVNMTKVFENSNWNKQQKELMQAEQEKMKAELIKMQAELQQMQANLKLMTPGSEQFIKLREEMAEKQAMLGVREDSFRDTMNRKMQKWAEDFHQRLFKVAEDLAKEKGLDLVITDELADFVQMTKSRILLYHNSQYDLTAEALAALDKLGKEE